MNIQRYLQRFPAAGEIVIRSGNTEAADRADGRTRFLCHSICATSRLPTPNYSALLADLQELK